MRREPLHPPAAVLGPPALRVAVGGRPADTGVELAPSRTWTVGRAADADVVVDDGLVSRRHLVLEPAGRGWTVHDVSSNGSWSGGRRIDAAGLAVAPGASAVVQLGAAGGPALTLRCAAAVGTAGAAPTGPAPRARPRRRRGLRLAIVLGVLVVLLVAADRIAAAVAGTQAVGQIVQQSQGLAGRPSVAFGGVPFLTQVAFGDYSDVHVTLDDVAATDAPRIDRIDAHLRGAHLPLAAVLGDDVDRVPIDRVDASIRLGFDDLNAYLAEQTGGLVVSPGPDGALRVSGTVGLDGTQLAVGGTARLEVRDGGLVVTPLDVQVGGGDDVLGGLGTDVASLLPPVPVPFDGLPFELRLTAVEVDSGGVTAAAQASALVLQVPR